MTISLYDISVPVYIQILSGLKGVLEKGLTFCKETGTDPDSLLDVRLIEDMFPLRMQIQQAVVHAKGTIDAVQSGQFSPAMVGTPEDSYATLQELVANTIEDLRKVTPEEVNAREDAGITFVAREMKLPFTCSGYILTFSMPNFYFHATTAYDILRMKGVPVGKLDFVSLQLAKA